MGKNLKKGNAGGPEEPRLPQKVGFSAYCQPKNGLRARCNPCISGKIFLTTGIFDQNPRLDCVLPPQIWGNGYSKPLPQARGNDLLK